MHVLGYCRIVATQYGRHLTSGAALYVNMNADYQQILFMVIYLLLFYTTKYMHIYILYHFLPLDPRICSTFGL